MLPFVVLTGGVVKDPEIRASDSGRLWVRLRVACVDRVRDGQGGWVDGDTTYLTVTAFGQQAENIVESTRKGDLITVSGRLQQREYEIDGIKRTDYGVLADEMGVSVARHTAKTPRVLDAEGDTSGAPF